MSFALISMLVDTPFARAKLMINQSGVWFIAFNVLLNRYESSIVRTQACAFLINLTQSIIAESPTDDQQETAGLETGGGGSDSVISISSLHLILSEVSFYHQISQTLTMFYPFDTFGLKNDEFNGLHFVFFFLS